MHRTTCLRVLMLLAMFALAWSAHAAAPESPGHPPGSRLDVAFAPATVNPGQQSTFSWAVRNAIGGIWSDALCAIDGLPGGLLLGLPASGSVPVSSSTN